MAEAAQRQGQGNRDPPIDRDASAALDKAARAIPQCTAYKEAEKAYRRAYDEQTAATRKACDDARKAIDAKIKEKFAASTEWATLTKQLKDIEAQRDALKKRIRDLKRRK